MGQGSRLCVLVQRLTSLMGSGDQFLAVRPQAGSTTPYPLEGLPVIILVPRERDIQLQMEDGEGGGKLFLKKILLFVYSLAVPCSMQNLSSLTRD